MRLTKDRREQIITSIKRDPEAHVLIENAYRQDGAVMVYIGARGMRFHRWLYEQIIGPVSPNEYVLRVCSVDGCLNPHHHKLSASPHPGRAQALYCPNGHLRTEANTDLSKRNPCLDCERERKARKNARERRARAEARAS